jgi:hypothetical protein
MTVPGFTAEGSLFRSKGNYRSSGGATPSDGGILLAFSSSPLEAFSLEAFGANLAGEYHPNADVAHAIDPTAKAPLDWNLHVVTSHGSPIVPMSEPGHQSNTEFSSDCQNCMSNCTAILGSCVANGLGSCAGCAPLAAIPFVGGALTAACVAVCVGVNITACIAAGNACMSGCHNIGSPCCWVDCGVGSCCNRGESCLDSAQGLCCSAGTQPCPGPQKSCFDPTTETCLSSGLGCPIGQGCGSVCCDSFSQCVDPNSGTCCNRFTQVPCGNQCCEFGQDCTDTGCCPHEQACGGICCPSGLICNASGQCVVPPVCQVGEFLCVSEDRTQQRCCPGGSQCCEDASCCPGLGSGFICCPGRSPSCMLEGECIT